MARWASWQDLSELVQGQHPMPLASTIRLTMNRVIPRRGRAYLFVIFAVACISWGLYAAIDASRPPASVHVRLAAGSSVARRFQIVETFASEARRRDLFVEVAATKGFEDSIRQLSEGKLDLAAVSSGLEISECKNVVCWPASIPRHCTSLFDVNWQSKDFR